MNRMIKNLLSLLILQGSNYIIPLLTIPYLSRTLNVEGFGIYSLVLSIAQYFVILTDFGFNLSATKKIAENQNNKKIISQIFLETIYAKSILCLISIIIISLMVYLKPTSIFHIELIYTILMVIGTVLMPIWFFQGIENISAISILTIIAKFIVFLLFFLLVKSENDIEIAVIIQSSVNILAGIVSLIYIHKKKLIVWVSFNELKLADTLKDSYPIFIATLSINIYTMSTPIIIGLVSTINEVSLFSAADKIKGAILGFFLILGNVFYPRINSLLSTNQEKAYVLIRNVFLWQSLFCIFLMITTCLFSKEIALLIYGGNFSDVKYMLVIFSPLYFFVIQSTVLGNYILLPHGYKREYTILPIVTSIVYIPLCLFFSKYYGAIGGAISILSIEIITFFILLFIIIKKELFSKIFLAKKIIQNEK